MSTFLRLCTRAPRTLSLLGVATGTMGTAQVYEGPQTSALYPSSGSIPALPQRLGRTYTLDRTATREWGQPVAQGGYLLDVHVHSCHHLSRNVECPLPQLLPDRGESDVETSLVLTAALTRDQPFLLETLDQRRCRRRIQREIRGEIVERAR